TEADDRQSGADHVGNAARGFTQFLQGPSSRARCGFYSSRLSTPCLPKTSCTQAQARRAPQAPLWPLLRAGLQPPDDLELLPLLFVGPLVHLLGITDAPQLRLELPGHGRLLFPHVFQLLRIV